jgi:hypothetical protein
MTWWETPMNWQMLVVELEGVAHRARYRVIGHRLEIETRLGRRRLPAGHLRPEIAAANALRMMLRQTPQAA